MREQCLVRGPNCCCSAPLNGRSRSGQSNTRHARAESFRPQFIAVSEALGRLRESPDYELSQISERKPGLLDELAAERAKQLEKESAELEQPAARLAEESKELSGEAIQII